MEGEGEAGGRGQLQDQGRCNPAAVRTGKLMGDLLQAGELGGQHPADDQNHCDRRQLASDLAGRGELDGLGWEGVRGHLRTDSLAGPLPRIGDAP